MVLCKSDLENALIEKLALIKFHRIELTMLALPSQYKEVLTSVAISSVTSDISVLL